MCNLLSNMIEIRKIDTYNKRTIDEIVNIHLATFKGFFLTFLGAGFLRQMYRSYSEFTDSGILIAQEDENVVGFLAYSGDLSGLYKYMIRKRLLSFAWYAMGAFIRKPKVFMRLLRAFLKPGESKRPEKYIELASIGVDPTMKSKGIGSQLIIYFKNIVDFDLYKYIKLETDAVANEAANHFYIKNGFELANTYSTPEGRLMNEYRYTK